MLINWYSVLDLSEEASPSEIRKAYRQKALLYHPDKNSSSDAPEKFRIVNEASAVLLDKSLRHEFDLKLRRHKEQEKIRPSRQKSNAHRIKIEQLKLESLQLRLALDKKMRSRSTASSIATSSILISFKGENNDKCIAFLTGLPGFASFKRMGAHLLATYQSIEAAEQALDRVVRGRQEYSVEHARIQAYTNRPYSSDFLAYIRGRLTAAMAT